MNRGSLAADAVSIRRLRATGVSESAVRRQLAAVPIPATRRLVFVRRIILRTRPDQVGSAMGMALTQLAEHGRSEAIAFADFPALVVACSRAAMTGGLGASPGGGWHWRVLGLSQTASPGEAVATLLTAHPMEAAAAAAALAANGLLAPVWRDLSEPAAARLTAALGEAAGFSPLGWPEDDGETSANSGAIGEYEAALARASAFWSPVLRPLSPRHEAVRTAAALSLLRWLPISLQVPAGALWRVLLARIAGAEPPVRTGGAERPARITASDGATTPTPVEPETAANGAPLSLAPQPTATIARPAGRTSIESAQPASQAAPPELLARERANSGRTIPGRRRSDRVSATWRSDLHGLGRPSLPGQRAQSARYRRPVGGVWSDSAERLACAVGCRPRVGNARRRASG